MTACGFDAVSISFAADSINVFCADRGGSQSGQTCCMVIAFDSQVFAQISKKIVRAAFNSLITDP